MTKKTLTAFEAAENAVKALTQSEWAELRDGVSEGIYVVAPASYDIQGATVIPGENWNADFILAIVEHGITQKVNDGAASALALTCPEHIVGDRIGKAASDARKAWVNADPANAELVEQARTDMRQAVADHMSNGEWGVVRQAGETIDPALKGRRSTAYEWMFNAGTPDANAARLAYKAIDAEDVAERLAHRDAVWDSHGSDIGAWKYAQMFEAPLPTS